MAKTETIHTRVTPEIKEQAEAIFSKLGLTTSQAIMLFLTASANHGGLPFELKAPVEEDDDLATITSIVTVDGVAPSKEAQKIIRLYSKGDIDYETAQFAIERMYKQA